MTTAMTTADAITEALPRLLFGVLLIVLLLGILVAALRLYVLTLEARALRRERDLLDGRQDDTRAP